MRQLGNVDVQSLVSDKIKLNHTLGSRYSEYKLMIPKEVEQYLIRQSNWKWLGLLFNISIIFGLYLCSELPNTISTLIVEKITHDQKKMKKFSLLISAYSYPNIILPAFSGILIDKIGLNIGIILFALISTVGQAVFTVSGYIGNQDPHDNTPFIVAIVGRFITGMGGESIKICTFISIMQWFHDQRLCFIIGLFFGISRGGYILDSFAIPSFASKVGLGPVLTFGLVTSVISLICAILLAILNSKSEK